MGEAKATATTVSPASVRPDSERSLRCMGHLRNWLRPNYGSAAGPGLEEPSASVALAAGNECREPRPERAFELVGLRLGWFTRIGRCGSVERGRLRVPEVDVEELDLVDQEHDRLAGGPDLFALVRRQPCSPGTQDADPLFVKPFRIQTSAVGGSLGLTAARSRRPYHCCKGLFR